MVNNSGELVWNLLKYAAEHPVSEASNNAAFGTDEEVKDFIRIFMEPTYAGKFNHTITSYGLKHACERTIGYIFHGSSCYNYVSNDQFKKAMSDLHFIGKPDEEGSPNMIYKFKWAKGAKDIFEAFGVYGTNHHESLKHYIPNDQTTRRLNDQTT